MLLHASNFLVRLSLCSQNASALLGAGKSSGFSFSAPSVGATFKPTSPIKSPGLISTMHLPLPVIFILVLSSLFLVLCCSFFLVLVEPTSFSLLAAPPPPPPDTSRRGHDLPEGEEDDDDGATDRRRRGTPGKRMPGEATPPSSVLSILEHSLHCQRFPFDIPWTHARFFPRSRPPQIH